MHHLHFSKLAPPEKGVWWKRQGLLGIWLDFTSPPRPADMTDLRTREYVRRSELVSITGAAAFVFTLLLVSNILSDFSTQLAEGGVILTTIGATILNRKGKSTVAAYMLVCMLLAMIMFSIIGATGGLRLIWFTTYDLFVFPIIISSLTIHRNAALVVALVAATFTLVDYSVHPHAMLTDAALGAHNFDEIAYEVTRPYFTWWAMINRNVLILLFSGLFAWLGAYSFEKALLWAEQSRDEVTVANAIVEYQETTANALVTFLHEVIMAILSGKDACLRPRPVNDPFYQATLLLNERLKDLQNQRESAEKESTVALWALHGVLDGVVNRHVGVEELAHLQTGVEIVDRIAHQLAALLRSLPDFPHELPVC